MRVNLKQIGLAKTSATIQLRPSTQVTTKNLQQIPFMAEISESFIFSYFFSSEGRNKKKLLKANFFFFWNESRWKTFLDQFFFLPKAGLVFNVNQFFLSSVKLEKNGTVNPPQKNGDA